MRGALLGCLLAACDPLADAGYVGEPMFTLVGTVTSPATEDAAGGLALMWQDSGGAGGPGVAATTVPVAIEFPSTFRVSVPVPPPDAARFTFDDVELAEAYVFAVADPEAARLAARGLDRTHVLVYASADVAAGTLAADYLGGPMSAGYHLRRYTPVAEPAPAQRAMIERCVQSGAPRAACEVRRRYGLLPAVDDEHLKIVVSP